MLDSGATRNLVYQTCLDTLPGNVQLVKIFDAETNYTVAAAFGDSYQCSEIATLKIYFTNDKFILSDFIIIPNSNERKLIIGRKLLHQLLYRLDENHQYITVMGEELVIDDNFSVRLFQVVVENKFLIDDYVKKYPDLFSDKLTVIPKHNFKYKVCLEGFDYHKPKPFYSNAVQSKHIEKFIQDGIDDNVLIQSDDPNELVALAPVFPIVQKDKVRVVTDFREINLCLKYQDEAIPPILVLIQNLATYSCFSTLDLKSAYFNVPLHEDGSPIGITTIFGNFKFQRLPFGLASAPAVFTRFMRSILMNLDYDKKTKKVPSSISKDIFYRRILNSFENQLLILLVYNCLILPKRFLLLRMLL